MTDPKPDDERLSALLDGQVQGRERDELLAHLAHADEDYEVFVDTADILRQLEETDSRELVAARRGAALPSIAAGARGSWRRRAPRWIVMSAVLAGFVVLGFFVLRGRTSVADPMHLAMNLERADKGLPPGWVEDTVQWRSRRGDRGVEEEQKAVRAGAMLVDLSIAVEAGNAADTRLLATRLRSRFDETGSALGRIADRAGEPASTLKPLIAGATERLNDRLPPEHLWLGAWAEAALLASRWQDQAFLRAEVTDEALERAAGVTRAHPLAHDALSGIRAALAASQGPDWQALSTRFAALLNAMAS